MIFLFRQKTPGNILVLLIVSLVLKMPLFLYPKEIIATPNDGALYHVLLQGLKAGQNNYALLCSLVAFLLLYIQALMINYFMNEFRMMAKLTYLPAMAYLLITTLLPEWNYLSSPLVACTFIIWIITNLFRLYNVPMARGIIYNIGLLLGLASYVYFPSGSFLLCFLLGIIILKPFRLNEIVLFILGCLTPYYFSGAFLFLKGNLTLATFLPHVSVRVPDVKSTIWLAASTIFLAVPFLMGGFFVQAHLHKMLIQVRKNWSILLLYLLLAFFVPFVNSYASFSNWILVAAPFACFHAATYFYLSKKWVQHVLFFLTVGFIFYLQYFTTLWR